MNYYIADLHLFCKSELSNGIFRERPFKTLEEMHDTIKGNWNKIVNNSDHIYLLGDLSKRGYSEQVSAFLSQLKGNIHLIQGNHDDLRDIRIRKQFVEITSYKEITDSVDGRTYNLILCHYPIFAWNGQHKGAIHLYGHCHDNPDEELYQNCIRNMDEYYENRDYKRHIPFQAVNVGCMHWNYTPVSLKSILEAIKKSNDILTRKEYDVAQKRINESIEVI